MRLSLRLIIVAASMCLGFAVSVRAYDTEKNHTGFYFYGMGGLSRMEHDTNARTNLKFAGDYEFGSGLTLGYNISDWIAPEIQMVYTTATGQTPSGQAREHAISIRLNSKYSFLTKTHMNRENRLKIYPYIKLGSVAHALYVNALDDNDKVGAYGFGFGAGGGLEFNIKALYFGIDVSNDFLYLQEKRKIIEGVDVTILKGGFSYQLSIMGVLGVHF